ncbi:MAG TPA: tryptophan--tRNA ligase [Fimbriimonadaceae bacterium]|nr:tryptophan--tRNA ligase [Fimbriimonadaceae bacterium]
MTSNQTSNFLPTNPLNHAKLDRLLTGDTPTGKLHLGHYVGSLENRVRLQATHDCFFIIANKHAFTTRASAPHEIRQSVLDVATDWLGVGLDPGQSSMFVQSEVPAIDELTFFFAMLLPFNRVLRNPTLKDEIRDKGLGDSYSFGFPLYSVGQTADILAFRPAVVPVGKDQLPHLEMTREVARKFNHTYCGVSTELKDSEQCSAGGLFPVIEPVLGRVDSLVGIGAPGPNGELQKMSKSLNNAIYLSDDAETVKRKVMSMYTDPSRRRATDPGTVEKNPLWVFLRAFHPDSEWVAEQADLYKLGMVGDVFLKGELIEVLNSLLDPIRERRRHFEQRPSDVIDALRTGTKRANHIAEETLELAKSAMNQNYFGRSLTII